MDLWPNDYQIILCPLSYHLWLHTHVYLSRLIYRAYLIDGYASKIAWQYFMCLFSLKPSDFPFDKSNLQTVQTRAVSDWSRLEHYRHKFDRTTYRRPTTTVEAETRWNWAYNLYHNSHITVTDSFTTVNNALTQSALLLQLLFWYRVRADS